MALLRQLLDPKRDAILFHPEKGRCFWRVQAPYTNIRMLTVAATGSMVLVDKSLFVDSRWRYIGRHPELEGPR